MFDLEEIGFTKEELQQRVVTQMCDSLLITTGLDEDGVSHEMPSAFNRELKTQVAARIKEQVSAVIEEHVLPHLKTNIEELTLQETNQWGEPIIGKKFTFIEYLVRRANDYMLERVDFDGKTADERGYGSHKSVQTRLTHMIHKYMHYDIENAVKAALKNANETLTEGLQETCKIKLKEIANALVITVKTK